MSTGNYDLIYLVPNTLPGGFIFNYGSMGGSARNPVDGKLYGVFAPNSDSSAAFGYLARFDANELEVTHKPNELP